MSIENTQEIQRHDLISLALTNLEYIFSEYRDFGAHEEEFKARSYLAYQLILESTCGGYDDDLALARKEVERFDKLRSMEL